MSIVKCEIGEVHASGLRREVKTTVEGHSGLPFIRSVREAAGGVVHTFWYTYHGHQKFGAVSTLSRKTINELMDRFGHEPGQEEELIATLQQVERLLGENA